MMDLVTRLEWRRLATAASRERDTRSPRAAAMGVATLSGLTQKRREREITATITRPVQISLGY